MAEATNTIPVDLSKLRGLSDLEKPIMEAVRLTCIAADMVDDALDLQHAEKIEGCYRFLLTDDQVQNLSFIVGEAQYRTRLMSEGYLRALSGSA